MFSWRITKYDPKNRDTRGAYLINEWTAYSDIDKIIDSKSLSYAEYLTAENAYVAALILFMECNNLESLQIVNLENNLKFKKDVYLSKEMVTLLKKIREVVSVNKTEVDLLNRLILREKLWCMFASKAMSVRFGWDYYMILIPFSTQKEFV